MKYQCKVKSKYVYPVLLIILAILVNGCVTLPKIRPQNIAVPPHEISSLEINTQLKSNIHLYDVIGAETKSSWSSNLEAFDFRTALNQSLLDADYLGTPLNSDYDLQAKLLDIDKPFAGISLTVTTSVEYILKERNTGMEIFKETIVESYTAKFSQATNAAVRLLIAIEGSARNNIHEFLKALSRLKIENNQVSISM